MTQTVARPEKSTIVRMYAAPWPVRTTFRALDRAAPRLAARWAERIWFTLPRTAARRSAGHPGGTRFVATMSGSGVGAAAGLVGEVWGDGPPVYLVHGWAGHRGQFAEFVGPLVARGYRVVAFDMPSHGDSSAGAFGPRSSTLVEFTSALVSVVARYGRPHAIVAHSAGAVATAGALCDGMRADLVVMLAPMASVQSYLGQFAATLGFGERTIKRLVPRVERRVDAPLRHFDVPEIGRAVDVPKTLVIHDRNDRSTAVTDGAAVAASWPGARLKVTTGLGHTRILRSPDVVAEAVDFIAS
jgi:pimeloyl-ACP methyl ester carboxylesterase